ncbi:MAG: 6-phosphogluconolactonase [Planctomycetota bacterium]|jgi:6-phosphogluconolactonase
MKTRNTKLNMTIAADSQEIAQEMLEVFVNDALKAIETNGRFCAAISQETPRIFFELLASDSRSRSLAWNNIHLFWADQCCKPSDCGNDNCDPTTLAFISKIKMPAKNMYRICSGCRSCEFAASTYEQTICNLVRRTKNGVPQFDLVLLRMDSDGHIASLFSDTYAFFESERLVWVTHFMDARLTRITMTHPILHAASRIIVSISGREKAEILREIFTSESNIAQYPVHALWPVLDKVTWLLDRDAAKFLMPSYHIETCWRKGTFSH